MKCIKCGIELPIGGTYCPGCGTMNEREVTAPPTKPKVKPMVAIIAVLAGVGLVALLVAMVMARGSGKITSVPSGVAPPPGNVTSAPPGEPATGNITTAPPGTPAPPSTTPSSVAKPKPPQIVVYYLDFVKKVEAVRVDAITNSDFDKELSAEVGNLLSNAFNSAGNVDAADSDPLAGITDKLEKKAKGMLMLLQAFDQAPAPPECRKFSGAYRNQLYTETETIFEAYVGLNHVKSASYDEWQNYIAKNKNKQSDANVRAASNGEMAQTADSALDEIVSQYDMKKPFSVSAEKKGGGNITSF